MKKYGTSFLFAAMLVTAVFMAGCNNNATDEQMNQLKSLRSQNSALQSQIADKQKQLNDLQSQLSAKADKLKQCQQDQDDAKKALGK